MVLPKNPEKNNTSEKIAKKLFESGRFSRVGWVWGNKLNFILGLSKLLFNCYDIAI